MGLEIIRVEMAVQERMPELQISWLQITDRSAAGRNPGGQN